MTLKELRVSKGLSQTELANLIGAKSVSAVSLWERGKHGISKKYFDALTEVLGGVPEDLLSMIKERGRPIGS